MLSKKELVNKLSDEYTIHEMLLFEQLYKVGYDDGYKEGWDAAIDHVQESLSRLSK